MSTSTSYSTPSATTIWNLRAPIKTRLKQTEIGKVKQELRITL